MENFTTSMIGKEETEAMLMKSKEGHSAVVVVVANPFASSREPLPYDPMLGWYTAATLSGLLILFLACVGLEKVKDKILMTFEKEHQGNVHRASLLGGGGGGCDAGQARLTRSSNDDPKCLAESDALLGRNCVDHNYVYLTLDRPNHVDANSSGPLLPGVLTTRSPTDHREGEGADPVPSTETTETTTTAADGIRDVGTTTRTTPLSSFGAVVQTHDVKIEIVEVHSASPVHEMAVIEEKDVHESAV